MKKHFNKELLLNKNNEDFENSTKCQVCDNYFDGDIKVRDHCKITGQYKGLNQVSYLIK